MWSGQGCSQTESGGVFGDIPICFAFWSLIEPLLMCVPTGGLSVCLCLWFPSRFQSCYRTFVFYACTLRCFNLIMYYMNPLLSFHFLNLSIRSNLGILHPPTI